MLKKMSGSSSSTATCLNFSPNDRPSNQLLKENGCWGHRSQSGSTSVEEINERKKKLCDFGQKETSLLAAYGQRSKVNAIIVVPPGRAVCSQRKPSQMILSLYYCMN